ncbi:MAG: hypothetical protein HY883_03025 [Deltaproteobacteria bacterium]|nr:hypothetical protein [Deltaproteobacteria bacterium]
MESKAHKAALERIKKLIRDHENTNFQTVKSEEEQRADTIESIGKILYEYYKETDGKAILESVYDVLMEGEYYEIAASFAKKHGL